MSNILSSFMPSPVETLQRKVEQVMMIDLPGHVLSGDTESRIREHAWGGVILFAKNVQSRGQVARLCADLQKLSGTPLLVAVDQEGGLVNRLAFEDSATGCGNMALSATGSEDLTYQVCQASARELRSAGFNVDFAPCIDINSNPANPIIGVRSFGQSPGRVARFGAAAVRGYQDGGISACAKHFPGHGDTHLDSHEALPRVDRPVEQLEREELWPFRAAIEAGVDGVMTAHIVYPTLDATPGLPATLSGPILTGLLREKMKFDGVIYSDSLLMKAIADNFGMGEAAVQSLAAGADMILALGPQDVQEECVATVCLAIEEGRLPKARLDDAFRRVVALKRKRGAGKPHDGAASSSADMDVVRKAAEASITVLRNPGLLPLAASSNVLVLTPSSLPHSPLGDLTPFPHLQASFNRYRPEAEVVAFAGSDERLPLDDLVARATGRDAVVLGLYARSGLQPQHLELARRLDGTPLIVLLLASPYVAHQLPERAALVTGYNCTRWSVDAMVQVVLGLKPPQGHCPVALAGIGEEGLGLTW
ncbi:MAG TPA: beta-N-acetylhexosaminidase [Candidatus Xenobia bacterium]